MRVPDKRTVVTGFCRLLAATMITMMVATGKTSAETTLVVVTISN